MPCCLSLLSVRLTSPSTNVEAAIFDLGLIDHDFDNAIMGLDENGETFTGFYNMDLSAGTSIPFAGAWTFDILLAYSAALTSDSKVAISDVGAIAYFSERHIIDMFGLNDRHIASIKGRMHYKTDPKYVLSRQPDYVVLVSLNDQGGGYSFQRVPDYALNALPAFHEQYELIRTVPQHWNNEFALIYERKPTQTEEAPQ